MRATLAHVLISLSGETKVHYDELVEPFDYPEPETLAEEMAEAERNGWAVCEEVNCDEV